MSETSGVSMPIEAITDGPYVLWKHVDGPLLEWAGHMHWLSLPQILRIWCRWSTIDEIACAQWPYLAEARKRLRRDQMYTAGGDFLP